jgi:hypothetical protein
MGMDQAVTFPQNSPPRWRNVSDLLCRRGFPVQVRMIDGELALPNEIPPETWRELRVGTPQGMITIRRESDHFVFVTWGNADASLRQAWNAMAWAFAKVCAGQVRTPSGLITADEFQRTTEMPPSLTFDESPGSAPSDRG